MQQAETDYLAILNSLAERQVEFIVVGGVSAVLQGAPIATFDLDVVHSLSAENVQKLLKALDELNASYRTGGNRNLKPEPSHFSSPRRQLLMTRFGPLDLLGSIGKDRRYEELLTESRLMPIGSGLEVRVLDLSMVIKTKEETAHEKDVAVLAILRRTLEEKKRQRISNALPRALAARAPWAVWSIPPNAIVEDGGGHSCESIFSSS